MKKKQVHAIHSSAEIPITLLTLAQFSGPEFSTSGWCDSCFQTYVQSREPDTVVWGLLQVNLSVARIIWEGDRFSHQAEGTAKNNILASVIILNIARFIKYFQL